MPAIRDPEKTATWDLLVPSADKTAEQVRSEVEDALILLRLDAAERAKQWLLDRGYFNGEITQEIQCTFNGTPVIGTVGHNAVRAVVTLSDFGLPYAEEDDKC